MEGKASCCRGCHGICVGSLEERVIRHCAPTLAGIKCGSMFRMRASQTEIMAGLRSMNRILRPFDVMAMALRSESDALLVYVFRPKMLSDVLSNPKVGGYLSEYGYRGMDCAGSLRHLRARFIEKGMPHEVGIFLGYPLADVEGFMRNGGRSCVCAGCWKSYGDAAEAEIRFRRCRECTRRCMEIYSNGGSLADLAAPSAVACSSGEI
ncbi:MAG: DUF3793 family protein [Candidatus Methanomethylophilaceae archaeon]|nr:DUF3793 family protein [Candidatus Methanomethylophilaceae archaeon]